MTVEKRCLEKISLKFLPFAGKCQKTPFFDKAPVTKPYSQDKTMVLQYHIVTMVQLLITLTSQVIFLYQNSVITLNEKKIHTHTYSCDDFSKKWTQLVLSINQEISPVLSCSTAKVASKGARSASGYGYLQDSGILEETLDTVKH